MPEDLESLPVKDRLRAAIKADYLGQHPGFTDTWDRIEDFEIFNGWAMFIDADAEMREFVLGKLSQRQNLGLSGAELYQPLRDLLVECWDRIPDEKKTEMGWQRFSAKMDELRDK